MVRIMILLCAAVFFAGPSIAAERTLLDEKGRPVLMLEVEGKGDSRIFRYENADFGYRIDIPEQFDSAIVLSDNDDGVALETKNRQARLSIYAAIDVSEENVIQPKTAIDALLNYLGDKVTFKQNDFTFFTVIWREGETEFYRRIVYQNGVFYTMDMRYPVDLADEYKPMAAKIGASLAISD